MLSIKAVDRDEFDTILEMALYLQNDPAKRLAFCTMAVDLNVVTLLPRTSSTQRHPMCPTLVAA